MEVIKNLANSLENELIWFQAVVNTALTLYFKNESKETSIKDHAAPSLKNDPSPYAKIISEYELTFEDRIILILALIPIIRPQLLDVFLIKNQNLNCDFSEFGGIKENNSKGFLPTLETACFILGDDELEKRFNFLKTYNREHLLFRMSIIELDGNDDFGLHRKLSISNEYMGLFTTGKRLLPQYSTKFPAKEIKTDLTREDLIVEEQVTDDLDEIRDWLIHSDRILIDWNLEKNLKPGFRALFYGPPGTGKTFAATLLGKATDRPVFRVDLSMVVSKYIGETEKNLGRLFDEAEHKDWILFFDEADALFGKRTQTRGANDRYANQEVAYLLQRIEDFSGLVILATNIQSNIDKAFSRRFQSMIHFPKPKTKQRRQLWENLFKENFIVEETLDLDTLADTYELTGGEMINILRYCALESAKRNKKELLYKDVITGIRREYAKQNKTI
ncbi:ATP-binding protein [Lutimonas halocynthiae]|uniref:ATP-binding protein n=1 Tax=Lutimonas halocynthiae TaxID=1446477 RepID=UPI0025B44A6E|nr:ATP-binding protein [Lutimonas halocynthiae]